MADQAKPEVDPFFAKITDLADNVYKLEGSERDDFIHAHMTKAGYKVTRSYVPPENSGNGANGKPGAGWFKD